MSVQFSKLAKSVGEDGRIDADEILSLRRLGWGDGIMTREEAEAIFALNNQISDPSEEWTAFFVEAIREYVLFGTEPRGMCDELEARWLITQVDADGKLESMAELETLVRILERADNTPRLLKDYVIGQIENAVLHGDGPTRCGGELAACHISNAECTILRRAIFAAGGDGPASVSRNEAEVLFRLKDATLDASNALEWAKLFVDGVSNYVQGFASSRAQLSHGRMKELEAFMNDTSSSVTGFLGRAAKEAPNIRNHFGKVFGRKVPEKGYTERSLEGEEVTEIERTWLNAMIDADGEFDALEIKLVERLNDNLHAG
jgi:hypothetical protein